MTTSYNQAPNPTELPQNFLGSIEYKGPQNTPILNAELSPRSSEYTAEAKRFGQVFISSETPTDPVLGEIEGEPVLAEVTLSGDDAIKMYVMKYDGEPRNPWNRHVRSLLDDPGILDKKGLILYVTNARDGGEHSFAIVGRSVHLGVVGRRSNLDWVNLQGERIAAPTTSRYVSRNQLTVSCVEDRGLLIRQDSETVATKIKTYAMPEHQRIVEAQEEAERERQARLERGRGLKGRLRGLFQD